MIWIWKGGVPFKFVRFGEVHMTFAGDVYVYYNMYIYIYMSNLPR